jgi:hypothetical protein
MDRIQIQASKVWDLLFDDETANTYQNALNLTGTLIKESALLIWLVICSFFVFGAWFSETSMKTGKSLRDWIDQLGNESGPTADQKPIAETGKSLLETGRTGVSYLINQAREQLGLEPSLIETKPAVKPAAKPASTPVSAAPSAPAPSTPPTQPTTRPSAVSEISRETVDDGWSKQDDE